MKRRNLSLVFFLALYIGILVFNASCVTLPIFVEPNAVKDFTVTADTGFSLTKVLNWTDKAHQGVTTDGTYVYTTNSTCVSKYTEAGVFQSSRDCSSDGDLPTVGLGDLCYYAGFIYITAHNADSSNCTILKYNATTLAYIIEYDLPEPTVTNAVGTGSVAYLNNSFWTASDGQTAYSDFQLTKFDTSFNYQSNWTIDSFNISGSWHYQGIDWYNNTYLFAVVHESSTPECVDVYRWTGDGLDQYTRIESPSWVTGGNTNQVGQGIAIIQEGAEWFAWFATRNGLDQLGEVGKFRIEAIGWNIINTPILQFYIPIFTGSLDALVILLGLILIPASTLYLVKGGRDELSTDKLFFFLVLFFMGWALFLGGIMP